MRFRTMTILTVAAMALAGCTVPEDRTKRAVEANGLTLTEVKGANPLACSEDDTLSRRFIAKTATGTKVTGTVCSGLFFKGATVRID